MSAEPTEVNLTPTILKAIEADLIMLARNLRAQESDFTKLVNDVTKDFEALRTQVHNFADDWTRRIENMESEVNPGNIRKEMSDLLANFSKLSK